MNLPQLEVMKPSTSSFILVVLSCILPPKGPGPVDGSEIWFYKGLPMSRVVGTFQVGFRLEFLASTVAAAGLFRWKFADDKFRW